MKKLTISILIGICMILSAYARNSMVIREQPLKTMTGYYVKYGTKTFYDFQQYDYEDLGIHIHQ